MSRRQLQKLVPDRGELGDHLAAPATQMAQRRVALLAFGDAERQLGGQLPHLLIPSQRSSDTLSCARSFSMAERIRVFTVPNGTPSSSLISRAVNP
jgi:hypothetical protein